MNAFIKCPFELYLDKEKITKNYKVPKGNINHVIYYLNIYYINTNKKEDYLITLQCHTISLS